MKRIYLVALVLFLSSTVVFGQSNKKKTKSASADTEVTASDVASSYDSYVPETTTKPQVAEQPATATESVKVLPPRSPSIPNGFVDGKVELVDGIYVDENNVGNLAVPLAYVRQADVMWSKKLCKKSTLEKNLIVLCVILRQDSLLYCLQL